MRVIRLRYIHRVKDRYGKIRLYLRRPGHPAIPLPPEADAGFFDAYQKAVARTNAAVKTAPINMDTLAALGDAWQRSAQFKQLTPSSQQRYRLLLASLAREDYAMFKVKDFEPRHIRRAVARLADKPGAANNRLKMLRALFAFAIEDGWRETNPTNEVRRLKAATDGFRSWTDAEIAQYEACWPSGSKERLALALLLYTGQRRSDVVEMGWGSVEGGLMRVRQGKTNVVLHIPIHDALLSEIEQCDPFQPCFLMAERHALKPFTANGFYMRFKSWRRQAGLGEGLSPHGLRKAAARRLAEAGCSPHQIASITGHKTLAEVERYTRSVDQKRLAAEAMERIARVKHYPQ